jgi:hypothetical protein
LRERFFVYFILNVSFVHVLRCKSGVVNLYNLNECLLNGERNPKPLKSFMNLTTPCTSIKFNQSNELMAICSSYTENACKLVSLLQHKLSLTFLSILKIQKCYNWIRVCFVRLFVTYCCRCCCSGRNIN